MNGETIVPDEATFLGLNEAQWMSHLRSVAKIVGSMLVMRGWVTTDHVTEFIADIPTWVGIVLNLVGIYTSNKANA